MNLEQKKQIVLEVKRAIHDRSLSQSKAAQQMGISAALLTQMLKGNHESISDEKWRLVSNWSGYRTGWRLAQTASVVRVFNICTDAKQNVKALALSDEPGCGKSASLKWYCNVNANAFYVECEEFWSKKFFCQKVLQAMGEEAEGSVPYLVDVIVNRLLALDAPLLIIDEADKLKDAVLQLFKTFYNKTEGSVGYVLAGAPYFKDRMIKGCNRNKQAYKEIRSRLGGEFISMRKVTDKDLRLIAIENGVAESDLNSCLSQIGNISDIRIIRRLIEKFNLSKTLSIAS